MALDLTPDKALIFRIVHRDNMPWILDHGLHCRSSTTFDPNFVSIGNPDLIDKRSRHPVPRPPGGMLGDYVPFYFTPRSPMLLNIRTGYGGICKRRNDEIVVLVSSLVKLAELKVPFLFADRHAYLTAAQFHSDPARLDQIDWPILRRSDFGRDPEDPGKMERYQAEALVYRHLPVDALLGMACYTEAVAAHLNSLLATRGLSSKVVSRPMWYFQ
jgi:hypothetical protein